MPSSTLSFKSGNGSMQMDTAWLAYLANSLERFYWSRVTLHVAGMMIDAG